MLTEHGLDIVGAGIATWPDGGVLDSFVVRPPERPPAKDLALAFERGARRRRLTCRAMPSLHVEFDNDALPWHTAVHGDRARPAGALQA